MKAKAEAKGTKQEAPKHSQTVTDLLQALEKAKADKDRAAQRKLRRMLRAEGYYVGTGEYVKAEDLNAKKEAKRARAKARREAKKTAGPKPGEEKKSRKSSKKTQEPPKPKFKHFEIDEDTEAKDIKLQYKALCKKNHPDVGGTKEAMQEINAEYKLLKTIFGIK